MFSFTKISLSKLLNNNTKWLETQQTSINSAALIIALANIFSILFGYIRTRTVLVFFTEDVATAWRLAFQIPDMLFQLLIFGALSASFIPVFLAVKKETDKKTALRMGAIILNILLLLFTVTSIIVFIFAEPITLWRLGNGISQAQIEIVIKLTRIMLFAQIFFAISNVLTGILQSFKRFIIPSIAPILYNLGIILGIIGFHSTLGIYSAGVGVILGALLHMAIQIPLNLKLGFKPVFSLNINHPGVKKLFILAPPRLLTIGVIQIQTLALGFFATSIDSLSFLYISYATYISVIPIRLFGVPLSQAALPFLSQYSSKEETAKFKGLIIQSLNQISFLALPVSVLFLILRIPIIRLAFGTDNFSWTSTIITGKVLGILALSITAQAMVHLLIRGFHALKNTKTPLMVASLFTIFYLFGSFIIVTRTTYGVIGLAVVSAFSFVFELILYFMAFNKIIPKFIDKSLIVPQLKMLGASFFMAIFLYLPFRIFDELIFNTTKTIELIGLTLTTGTIGMLVYVYFAAIFEIKELSLITRAVQSFNRKRKTNVLDTKEFMVGTSVDDDIV